MKILKFFIICACLIPGAITMPAVAAAQYNKQPVAFVKAFHHSQGLYEFAGEANLQLLTWDLSNAEWAIAIKPAKFPARVAYLENQDGFGLTEDGSFIFSDMDIIEEINLRENSAYVIGASISEGVPTVLITVTFDNETYAWNPAFSGMDGSLIANAQFAPMTMENARAANVVFTGDKFTLNVIELTE